VPGNGKIRGAANTEFTKDVERLRRKFHRIDGDLKKFFDHELAVDPRRRGDKIPGIAGAYKTRCGIPSANISKRDGLRIIYLISDNYLSVVLLMVYAKAEKTDVSRVELRRAVDQAMPIVMRHLAESGHDPELARERLANLLAD
jgi:hypothetical protein